VITGGTDADAADSLYIGSGTHTIDGTWEIYSTYVQIDPNAVITGSGTIVFYNPSVGFGASTATKVDVNNISSAIDVNIDIQNDQTITLTEMPLSAELTGVGWTENTTNNSLNVGRDLSLGIDGGHVVLGNSVQADLLFDDDATVSNYRPNRHVVTNNSILSHVVKENYSSAFTFPIGIAAGDYTPAQISNASNNTVSVSVQDYTNSASPEALVDGAMTPADGVNRTWHIYANNSGISSTVNLQHNSSTNQAGFSDLTQFVTQWGTTTPNTSGDLAVYFSMSPWQTNTQGPGATGTLSSTGAVAGSSLRGRTFSSGLANSAAANESYFTKSSDAEHPLPIVLDQLNVKGNACSAIVDWKVGVEDHIDHYDVQHSVNGITFTTIASIKANKTNGLYSYTHQVPANGLNLYRLQLVERSNDYTVSKTVSTNINCPQKPTMISAFPNPTHGLVTLDGLYSGLNTSSLSTATVTIQVVDINGQIVLDYQAKNNRESIDITNLAQANYVIRVLYNNEVKTQLKIMKL
jgi:hypothetical protein